MANTDIQITDLDFSTIKSTLKTYLQGQTVFTDYDFEGSALSTLLDVLAYNTHYNAYYVNMIANEMFLDSASQRDSAVSIAKHLGYTPKSKSAASSAVTLVMTEDGAKTSTSVTVPQYAKFTASVDGKSYNFYTMKSYSSSSPDDTGDDNIFTISGVVLKEGTKLNRQFVVVDNAVGSERYVIPNTDVDSSTIVVKVKENSDTADSGYVTYTKNTGIKTYTSTDPIYFLQEVEDGKFEIVFGDGSYGKQLAVGNVISVDYLTTKGPLANGAGSNEVISTSTYGFSPVSSTASWAKTSDSTAVNVSVVAKVSGTFGSIATGGSDPESLESIKFTAPISYQSQNRALTSNDYKAIVLANYNNVDSIRVWGGEDNARPEYGKVFIVVKPKNGTLLTTQNITDIKEIVDTYKPMGIVTSVKSPDYLYLDINTTITYNPNASTETEGTLKTLALDAIMNYNTTNLATFDSVLRFSQLTGIIDDTENSFISNKTIIGAREHKAVTSEQLSTSSEIATTIGTGVAYKYDTARDILFTDIDLKAPIKPGTFKSDTFTTLGKVLSELNDTIKTVYYKDDSNGNINILTTDGNLVFSSVGTINYQTGKISKLSAIRVLSIVSTKNYIKFTGDIENQDVYPENTQVILFEESDVTVTMKSETV